VAAAAAVVGVATAVIAVRNEVRNEVRNALLIAAPNAHPTALRKHASPGLPSHLAGQNLAELSRLDRPLDTSR
jgi:hypothetical protein